MEMQIAHGCPCCCSLSRECIRVFAEMNLIFWSHERSRLTRRTHLAERLISLALFLLALNLASWRLHAQSVIDEAAEFKRNVQELSSARLGGAEDNQAQMEKALSYLDSIALAVLNASTAPDLEKANQHLAGLVSRTPPVGENYRLLKLGGDPAVYAMVINFGLGGPAAVRLYAGAAGRFTLAARIDHLVDKDFFDSDLELVPVSSAEPAFVIVAGRTDDLSTGMFSAWLFDGRRVSALWSSDLLQQSAYETDEKGFHLAYCSQVDEEHPSQCLKMSRDLYQIEAGEWKRIETSEISPPKPAPK